MYGGNNQGGDDVARMQMSSELERLKEQSRVAIHQSVTRVEQLQEEQRRISAILNEKEEMLQQAKTRHLNAAKMNDNAAGSSDLHGSNDNGSTLNTDVRIQLMIQERDEKMREIQEIINDKEVFLRSLHDDTEEQQETIQELQQILEGLQSASRDGLRMKVLEKERDVDDLEDELDELQQKLSEADQRQLELEEEWNDREDLVADAEAESADKLSRLQEKVEMYSSEIESMRVLLEELKDSALQRLEAMRQDCMEFLGPETCHSLMILIHQSFEEIQRKEQELASALVRRLDERKLLIPPALRLEILDQQCDNALRKLGDMREVWDAKMRFADSSEIAEGTYDLLDAIQDQIASGFDEIAQELVLRLDNLEENVFEAEDGTVEGVQRSMEKLNFAIQAKFRQILRALSDSPPDPVEQRAVIEQQSSQHSVQFDVVEYSVPLKGEELERLEKDVASDDVETEFLSDSDKKKIALLEEEIEFITFGLREKDRMISTIVAIAKEREDAEAYLVEELQLAYKKGIIFESDFSESDNSFLEKARI
jgi:hypothetical protein